MTEDRPYIGIDKTLLRFAELAEQAEQFDLAYDLRWAEIFKELAASDLAKPRRNLKKLYQ